MAVKVAPLPSFGSALISTRSHLAVGGLLLSSRREAGRSGEAQYRGGGLLSSGQAPYQEINEGKRSFEAIDNEPEPRVYYENPGEHDYVIPGVAEPMLTATVNPSR